MSKPLIEHVTDTAMWVATFRARESLRKDALFNDPYAAILAGPKGESIANDSQMSRFTEWVVILRTVIIDRMIQECIADGVDLVVNLGAGLDTRPYRMNLPEKLQWVEVDFPSMIDYKEKILRNENPHCVLERMRVDLSDSDASQKCFANIASKSKKILVITEGVMPYLSNTQARTLAENLHSHASFQYWIMEYLSPSSIQRLQNDKRAKKMKNAPFQFTPGEWMEFFQPLGWKEKETKYLPEVSKALKRPTPFPLPVKILIWFLPKKQRAQLQKMSGFTLYERF